MPKFHKYAVAVIVLFAGVAFYLAACAPTPSRQPKKRTRFQRKECLECHTEFKAKYLSMKTVHAVVKEQKCEDCHLRHGVIPKLLLKKEGNQTCYACHEQNKIGMDKSFVHTALTRGKCIECHNPHASEQARLLKASEKDICYQCHQSQDFAKPVLHQPLKTDTCLECHLAHGSDQQDLLKTEQVTLCLSCHDTQKSPFKKAHRDLPVETASCNSCHNPHSSLQPALLKTSAHEPVAKVNCDKCHVSPSAGKPFATVQTGRDLCQTCHKPSDLRACRKVAGV